MLTRESAAMVGAVCVLLIAAGQPALAQVPAREALEVDTVPAEETAAAFVDPDWQVPRTSWGHPSFEGVWTTDDMQSVPRDRPEEFGMREKLTPEEFAERAQADAERWNRILNEEQYSANSVGSRTFGWTSQVIDPPNGRIPPLNEAGRARMRLADRGTYGPGPFKTFSDLHLYDRCITRGILGSKFAVIYGNGMRIVQNPDSLAISYEMLPDTRIVHLDGRPHAQDNIRQYMGNSRGYWDGDSLVIETRNLTNKTSIGGNGIGTRHSEEMEITERLTRVDPEMILYVARVEDPLTYTEPFTVRMMLTTQPGYEIFEYSCHERNRAVSGALGGERIYEERAARALANDEPLPERITGSVQREDLPEDEADFIDVNRGEADE